MLMIAPARGRYSRWDWVNLNDGSGYKRKRKRAGSATGSRVWRPGQAAPGQNPIAPR